MKSLTHHAPLLLQTLCTHCHTFTTWKSMTAAAKMAEQSLLGLAMHPQTPHCCMPWRAARSPHESFLHACPQAWHILLSCAWPQIEADESITTAARGNMLCCTCD